MLPKCRRDGIAMSGIPKEIFRSMEKYIDISCFSFEILEKGGGVSDKIILSKDGAPRFILRITPRNCYARTYECIDYLYKKGAPFSRPLCGFRLSGTGDYCLAANWAHGSELDVNSMKDRSEIYPFARKLAEALHRLHDIDVTCGTPCTSMEDEISLYFRTISDIGMEFPFKKEFMDFLRDGSSAGLVYDCSFVHMDLHLHNVVWAQDGQPTLIDYENIMITDCYREFVYAVSFHGWEEDIFWLAVIFLYFNGKIPQDFWQKTRFYSVVHLFRMLIFESRENDRKKINWLCRTIYNRYNGLKCAEPDWFIKYKAYIGQLEWELNQCQ